MVARLDNAARCRVVRPEAREASACSSCGRKDIGSDSTHVLGRAHLSACLTSFASDGDLMRNDKALARRHGRQIVSVAEKREVDVPLTGGRRKVRRAEVRAATRIEAVANNARRGRRTAPGA